MWAGCCNCSTQQPYNSRKGEAGDALAVGAKGSGVQLDVDDAQLQTPDVLGEASHGLSAAAKRGPNDRLREARGCLLQSGRGGCCWPASATAVPYG